MILAIQPNKRKNILLSPAPKSKNKKAQTTANAAPKKERIGITNNFLIGFGIVVLSETVMENK